MRGARRGAEPRRKASKKQEAGREVALVAEKVYPPGSDDGHVVQLAAKPKDRVNLLILSPGKEKKQQQQQQQQRRRRRRRKQQGGSKAAAGPCQWSRGPSWHARRETRRAQTAEHIPA